MAKTGALISELQSIWEEIGEDDNDKDKMMSEVQQQCLDVYRRLVDKASRGRAQIRQEVVDSEAEIAKISAELGEQPPHIKKNPGSLKEELQAITPQLEVMRNKRRERSKQFDEVMKQINRFSEELSLSKEEKLKIHLHDATDLSLKRLDDLRNQLHLLEKEKSDRLRKVLDQLKILKSLCMVLGMDFKLTVRNIHPTLDESSATKSVTADSIESLTTTIGRLKDEKLQRLQKLQGLAMTMVELWNLMDTPVEEQQLFQNVACTIAASESEITELNSLSVEVINDAKIEVMRLQEMKLSKMKEVLLKKKLILEEICRGAHMVVEGQLASALSVDALESGAGNPSFLLEQLETEISKAKEEAFCRKETLEKVQKWLSACEEESWLEEYNRSDNRYNAGKGMHLTLKRAEKARVLVNKIPGMVEMLKSKVKAWEEERGSEFLYDGVGLLSMVEQYCDLKRLKEQERQRERDQKKLHGLLMTEQEAIYGSKPSPTKSGIKNSRPSTVGVANKRFSVGGAVLQNALAEKSGSSSRFALNNPAKQMTPNNQSRNVHMAYSSGKKIMSSGPVKHHLSNKQRLHQADASPMRKPLSPISSLSSKINSLNYQDPNQRGGAVSSVLKTPTKTPRKNVSAHDENRTPQRTLIPMQTAMTPYTPGHYGSEEVEYSYEERRAGFTLPSPYSKAVPLA